MSYYNTYGETLNNKIYDRDYELIGIMNDSVSGRLKLKDMDQILLNGIIAVEDKDFWKNKGISFSGISRAAYHLTLSIFNYFLQKIHFTPKGGSTITQQMVRLVFLKNHKISMKRKYDELIYTLATNFIFQKKDILTLYVNHAYFGLNIVGFESAANILFNKSLNEISVGEKAILIACLKTPLLWQDDQKCIERRNYVAKRMFEENVITKNEYNEAIKEELNFNFHIKKSNYSIVEMVSNDLKKYGAKKVANLAIQTTISSKIQTYAQDALSENCNILEKNEKWMGPIGYASSFSEFKKYAEFNTEYYCPVRILDSNGKFSGFGFTGILSEDQKKKYLEFKPIEKNHVVIITRKDRELINKPTFTGQVTVMDMENGDILAYTGSSDAEMFKILVTEEEIGSCMKIFDLLTMLNNGYDLNTKIKDNKCLIVDEKFSYIDDKTFVEKAELKKNKKLPVNEWMPFNWDSNYYGEQDLVFHFRWSRNIPFINSILHIGLPKLQETLIKFDLIDKYTPVYPSTIIGSIPFNSFKFSAAVSTIFNYGKIIKPILIKNIKIKKIDKSKDKINNDIKLKIGDNSITETEQATEQVIKKSNENDYIFFEKYDNNEKLSGYSMESYEKTLHCLNQTILDGWSKKFISLPYEKKYSKTATGHDNRVVSCVCFFESSKKKICIFVTLCRYKRDMLGEKMYGAIYPVFIIQSIIKNLQNSGII